MFWLNVFNVCFREYVLFMMRLVQIFHFKSIMMCDLRWGHCFLSFVNTYWPRFDWLVGYVRLCISVVTEDLGGLGNAGRQEG